LVESFPTVGSVSAPLRLIPVKAFEAISSRPSLMSRVPTFVFNPIPDHSFWLATLFVYAVPPLKGVSPFLRASLVNDSGYNFFSLSVANWRCPRASEVQGFPSMGLLLQPRIRFGSLRFCLDRIKQLGGAVPHGSTPLLR